MGFLFWGLQRIFDGVHIAYTVYKFYEKFGCFRGLGFL